MQLPCGQQGVGGGGVLPGVLPPGQAVEQQQIFLCQHQQHRLPALLLALRLQPGDTGGGGRVSREALGSRSRGVNFRMVFLNKSILFFNFKKNKTKQNM